MLVLFLLVLTMLNQFWLLAWMLFILLASGALFSLKPFQCMDKSSKERNEKIDGLRFFMAVFVVFHHFALSYMYFSGKPWDASSFGEYHINQKMGSFGVAVFFMISGYLFANAKVYSWMSFYKKRVLRIAPLFTFSSVACILIAFILQRNNLDTSALLAKLYFWLDAGITRYKPDLFGMKDTQIINAGVTWTLFWEWAFYFSLPFMFIIRDKAGLLPVSVAALFVSIYFVSQYNQSYGSYLAFFATGALGRHVSKSIKIKKYICDIGALSSLIVTFLVADSSYNTYFIPFIMSFFLFIVAGSDMFGVLKIRGFIRLGDASYSIYLLHGIAWFCMNKYLALKGIYFSVYEYMALSTAVFFLLMFSCSLTYMLIESPFIRVGSRIEQKGISSEK